MNSSIKPTHRKLLSQLLLVVWLCSLIAHSNHGLEFNSGNHVLSQHQVETTDTLYQLDSDLQCHLCYNTIDRFDDVELTTYFSHLSSRVAFARANQIEAHQPSYFLPLLRGPPKSLNSLLS